MKVLILAGGFGTRMSEETARQPKPMVEIGGKPIVWHIMKLYSHYGFNEFVLLLGYRGYVIKEYFSNYFLHQSDVTIDLGNNSVEVHSNTSEPWKVTMLDTGVHTMTGGRILRARRYLEDQPFLLTYGDGVSNLDIGELLLFHEARGGLVTMTAVQPEGRFGAVDAGSEGQILGFSEKPKGDGGWINAGFFACQPGIFDYLKEGDETVLEKKPLESLAQAGELFAYEHRGFWKCMDTLRDTQTLNRMWDQGQAPWKVWSC